MLKYAIQVNCYSINNEPVVFYNHSNVYEWNMHSMKILCTGINQSNTVVYLASITVLGIFNKWDALNLSQ